VDFYLLTIRGCIVVPQIDESSTGPSYLLVFSFTFPLIGEGMEIAVFQEILHMFFYTPQPQSLTCYVVLIVGNGLTSHASTSFESFLPSGAVIRERGL